MSEENINDQNTEITQASTGSKKLMILYVLEVLIKYSDQYHMLSQGDIIQYIKQDYGMDCERKAISRHIKSLVEHGYNIDTYENNGQGYYLVDLEFSSEDVLMLWEGLMSSLCINKDIAGELIGKLGKYVGDDLRFGTSYYGGITNRYVYPRTFLYNNLKRILTELAMNKKISFYYNQYNKDKTLEPTTQEPITVSPYAVLNVDNEYYLAASAEYEEQVQCYKIGLMSQIEHLEFTGDDIKEKIGYANGFDTQRFLSEHVEGYGGPVTDFTVKVNSAYIESVILQFGENFRISHTEEDMLVVDIVCNFDLMYQWAIKTADYTEVVSPYAMKFQIKEFFDRNSWKYR